MAGLLAAAGLSRFAPRFESEEIDLETLPLLSAANLAEIGMTSSEIGALSATARRLGLGAPAAATPAAPAPAAPAPPPVAAAPPPPPAAPPGLAAASAPDDATASECPVCMEVGRDSAFVPCGHVLCRGCVERYASARTCPVCRSPIVSVMRIFL